MTIWVSMVVICLLLLSACSNQVNKSEEKKADWRCLLDNKLPLLGHRNWIVVTDMAYPLQSKPGILTLYSEDPFEDVLAYLQQSLGKVPHVYAHIYQDKELSLLTEELCPGIGAFRQNVNQILSVSEVTSVPHEQLIARLDSASQLFQVVIIKTNLTKPYTSVFFELDCKYWDADKQGTLMR